MSFRTCTGWAWQPDTETTKALRHGARKYRNAKRRLATELFKNQRYNPMSTSPSTPAKAPVKKTTAKKTTKKAPAKKQRTTGSKPAASKSNILPLKKILPAGMDPKVARRKLRAANFSGHDSRARWEFTPAQAKKAQEILSAS